MEFSFLDMWFLQELQGEGIAKNNRDLLDMLLTTTDDEGQYLTDDSIIDNLVTFLWAGYDTTAHTLLVTFRYLYLNQQCLEGVTRGESNY
jgi:cytochrome P450